MESIIIVITGATSIIVLVFGILLRGWMNEIKVLKEELKEGLATKVDGVEYVIKNRWQESEYGEMKVSIKELRASNDASHQAIMIELKRTNDILKKK